MPGRSDVLQRRLTTADFVRLALFRHALRRFLHFSQAAAARAGLTARHYQALLSIRGSSARRRMTINDLAQDLLIKHHSAVGLVDRLAARGLVKRERAPGDRRKVQVRLTPTGERVLVQLATVHRQELRRVGPVIHGFLEELSRPAATRAPATGSRKRNDPRDPVD